MTVASIPNRPAGSAPRAIADMLANFDAVTNVINGHLDETNMDPAAGYTRGKGRTVGGGGGGVNLVNGDSVLVVPNTTLFLPSAAAASQWVSIFCSSTVSYNTVFLQTSVGGQLIYGPGHETGTTSISLGMPSKGMTLVANGGAWFVISGEADSGWTAISLSAGVSSSGSVAPAVRQKGNQYLFRGAMNGSGVGALGNTAIAPPRTIFFKGGLNVSGGTTFPAFCTWSTGGALSAPATAAIVLDDVVINI